MLYMIYHKTTRPTGRVIAKALNLRKFGVKVPDFAPELLVRWGSSRDVPGVQKEVNAGAGIRKAASKIATFRTLSDAGVPTVPWDINYQALRERFPDSPIFGRKNYGSKGRDIVIFQPGQAPRYGEFDFFSAYIPQAREWRIHVVGDNAFRVQGKYLDFPDQAGDGMIHNYDHGYRFRAPRNELQPNRLAAAVSAVKALGLDFGAVDMIKGQDGNHYVLEVNTGPSCSPLTARGYVSNLAALITERSGGAFIIEPQYDALDALIPEGNEVVVGAGV